MLTCSASGSSLQSRISISTSCSCVPRLDTLRLKRFKPLKEANSSCTKVAKSDHLVDQALATLGTLERCTVLRRQWAEHHLNHTLNKQLSA